MESLAEKRRCSFYVGSSTSVYTPTKIRSEDKYVRPRNTRMEMYAGRVACWPLVSHDEYASHAAIKVRTKWTDGRTDRRMPERYITLTARRGHRNKDANKRRPICDRADLQYHVIWYEIIRYNTQLTVAWIYYNQNFHANFSNWFSRHCNLSKNVS